MAGSGCGEKVSYRGFRVSCTPFALVAARSWPPVDLERSCSRIGLNLLSRNLPFRLEPLAGSGPGTFRVRLDGPRGLSVQVQRASNLADWEDWKPVIFGATPV